MSQNVTPVGVPKESICAQSRAHARPSAPRTLVRHPVQLEDDNDYAGAGKPRCIIAAIVEREASVPQSSDTEGIQRRHIQKTRLKAPLRFAEAETLSGERTFALDVIFG